MIRRFIAGVALLCYVQAYSYDKLMFKNLHSRYLRNFSKTNNTIIEDQALQALLKISKISSSVEFQSVLTSPVIKDLFLTDVESQQENDELDPDLLGVQYLVLFYLYDQMFQRYIASTETFLNKLLVSQKYWMHEDFYMKQSWMNKNIFYNFYSSQYHRTVKKKIVFLQDIEQQVAYMLGVCLYGIAQIEQVNMEDQIAERTTQFVELFYQAYNTPIIDRENQKNPVRLYQDLMWINNNLEQHMQQGKKLLDEHSKPPFFEEHVAFASCAAATLVAMALWYKKYEEDIPGWCKRIKSMGSTFYRDYLINPAYKIVDNVWYNKATKMPKISLEKKIEKIPLIDQTPIAHISLLEQEPIGKMPSFKLESNIGRVPPFKLESNIGKVPELKAKLPIEEGISSLGISTPPVWGMSIPLIQGSQGLEKVLNDSKRTINSGVDFVNETGQKVINPAIDTINGSVSAVGQYVDQTGQEVINPAIATINSSVNSVGEYVHATGQEVINPAIAKVNSVFDVANKTIKDAVNPTIDKVNSGVDATNKAIGAVNSLIEGIEDGARSLEEAREKIINPMIETTELTLYMAMIGVGLFGGYLIYSGTKKGYNHYIKHENWYVPMRYIIRSIDQLLNKITRAGDSPDFAQDGKMYMLIQHLKEYISCLKDEELFLMNNDINELLSFDLNYYQKRGIVQRMYKTYAFLK